MLAQPSFEELTPRPSRVIAEALVERHSPSQITLRARKAGYPRPLTRAIVAACAAAACDGSWAQRKSSLVRSR